MPLDWNSFEEGDSIPELKKAPGVTQLVKYSAGGGDFNPLPDLTPMCKTNL